MFLFSFLSLSGCEQRAELGTPVTFVSQEQIIGDATSTKDQLEAPKEQEAEVEKEDLFSEETFTISSTEMGQNIEAPEVQQGTSSPSDSEGKISTEMGVNASLSGTEFNSVVSPGISPTTIATSNQTSWPIQLIGILDSATPKRATLRIADGSELSVQAGTMLHSEGMVVLAIGKNHVSLAKIIAHGDVTSIHQIDLQPLY